MNEQNDKDLREALRRREARRQKPQPSADFCDSVMQRIEARPAKSYYWRWAAAVACLFIIIGTGIAMWPTGDVDEPELLAQPFPSLVGEGAGVGSVTNTTAENINPLTPPLTPPLQGRGRAAHGSKAAEPSNTTKYVDISEPEVIDAADLAQQAIAEEEQRIAMQMMQQMNSSLQDDYVKMTREIRERGNSMTQKAEMAINDDAY